MTIGDLPAERSVTITFDVTVHIPIPSNVTQIANQGSITTNTYGHLQQTESEAGRRVFSESPVAVQ